MNDYNAKIVDEFRANAGQVGGPFEGAPMVLITTTGARSGQPRMPGFQDYADKTSRLSPVIALPRPT